MLIKESTLRRIIREELVLSTLREDAAAGAAGGGAQAYGPEAPTDYRSKISDVQKALTAKFITARLPRESWTNGGQGPIYDALAKKIADVQMINMFVPMILSGGKDDAVATNLVSFLGNIPATNPPQQNPKQTAMSIALVLAKGLREIIQSLKLGILNKTPVKPGEAKTAAGYNWLKDKGGTQPYYVRLPNGVQYTTPIPMEVEPSIGGTYADVLEPVLMGQKILAAGSKGPMVRAWQILLNVFNRANARNEIKVDGDFGKDTIDATEAFQIEAGVRPVDMKVGQQTMYKFFGRQSTRTGVKGDTSDKGGFIAGAETSGGGMPVGLGASQMNPAYYAGQKITQK